MNEAEMTAANDRADWLRAYETMLVACSRFVNDNGYHPDVDGRFENGAWRNKISRIRDFVLIQSHDTV